MLGRCLLKLKGAKRFQCILRRLSNCPGTLTKPLFSGGPREERLRGRRERRQAQDRPAQRDEEEDHEGASRGHRLAR